MGLVDSAEVLTDLLFLPLEGGKYPVVQGEELLLVLGKNSSFHSSRHSRHCFLSQNTNLESH